MPPLPPAPYVGQQLARWARTIIRYDATGASAAGTAGVHTAGIVLPAYCYLLDVALVGVTLWAGGTAATVIVGDDDDADGFFVSSDLMATDLLAKEAIFVGAGTGLAGGRVGAYIAGSQWAVGGGSTSGIYRTVARTVTATVTTTGTVKTAGETHLLVSYLNFDGREPTFTATYAAT